MRLIIEPKPYTQDIYVDTKLGRLSIIQFLRVAIKKDGRKEVVLNADAGIDHATFYSLMNCKGRGHALRAVLVLLDALGYDLMLVKRNE